jgi:hypothetical protein
MNWKFKEVDIYEKSSDILKTHLIKKFKFWYHAQVYKNLIKKTKEPNKFFKSYVKIRFNSFQQNEYCPILVWINVWQVF